MSYVKEGTVCYLSQKGQDNLFSPDMDEEYSSVFKEDTPVEIKNWTCTRKGLSAVLVEATNIESLVASAGIETIVWVNNHEIIKDTN